jgi:TfoX/Sxy family transcriptional regulator of competence genes
MKGKQHKPADDSFAAFVIDQLRGPGAVEARSMFGGKGLYWKDQMFGLIDESRLYFRGRGHGRPIRSRRLETVRAVGRATS